MSSNRVALLKRVLPSSPDTDTAITHALSPSSDAPAGVSSSAVKSAVLANAVADLSDDNEALMRHILQDPHVSTLRDVAFRYDPAVVASLSTLNASSSSESIHSVNGINDHPSPGHAEPFDAVAFQRRLFHAEPTAVVHRMIQDNQLHLAPAVRAGVSTFFANQPDFNIRNTSVVKALEQPRALEGVPDAHIPSVVKSLKTLQRVQALTSRPDAIPRLLKIGIESAHQVAEMPRAKFIQKAGDEIGAATASQIHDHAMVSTARNNEALLQIYQTIKGAGLAAIDGVEDLDSRMSLFNKLAAKNDVNISLESLFGGMDFCECDDCTTVISPANYFVELLQYLRNNDLDPELDPNSTTTPQAQKFPNTGQKGIEGTALQALLRRRPDLQHLQLTCENANTLIPYLDLANEVMESFVVHNPHSWNVDSQAEIDVFNVHDETSNELLAEAQHTNYKAYCILREAVYPLGILPFHQPLVAIRIYLRYLKTSRYEVLDIFRKSYVTPKASPPFNTSDNQKLAVMHDTVIERAVAAEYLGIIQEEYIILTKEAFWPKEYFEITGRAVLSTAEYDKHIGVRKYFAYWGYPTAALLNSDDLSARTGLSFVKAQFLKRAGMQYTDLVDLIKTKAINPVFPGGRALLILESIRFSYRFLQTLVKKSARNKREKFKLLIDFLESVLSEVDGVIVSQAVDQDETAQCPPCISRKEICQFIYQRFDCLGKIIVLESGEGPTLPVFGSVVLRPQATEHISAANGSTTPASGSSADDTTVGVLEPDGTIKSVKTATQAATAVGMVGIDSKVYTMNGELFNQQYTGQGTVSILSLANPDNPESDYISAYVDDDGSLKWNDREHGWKVVRWNAVVDSCNIDTVRILHLDGSPLIPDEWDRMQRFIRLWKRIGWTIDETDQALLGFSKPKVDITTPPPDPADPTPDPIVQFGDFDLESCSPDDSNGDTCSCGKPRHSCSCDDGDIPEDICKDVFIPEITPDFISDLVNLKKLQEATGMELIKILAFYADIDTSGTTSLYSRLFLTHSLVGVDPVFKPDENGNFLLTSTNISDHLPVLLAAFHLTRTSLDAILRKAGLVDSQLNVSTVSQIYRYALLSQTLIIKVALLIEAIELFGDPFQNATATLTFVGLFKRMSSAGFSVQQLTYALLGHDDPTQPIGPQKPTILKATKAIFDGLTDIETAHPDVTADTAASITIDSVTQNASLLFDQTKVAAITALLTGATLYTTNAPTGLTIVVPTNLAQKVSYVDAVTAVGTNRRASLNVTGILTVSEISDVKALSTDKGWSDAVDRIQKQPLVFFKNELSDIFPDQAHAIATLLSGDIIIPSDKLDPTKPDPNTAPGKELCFVQNFLPYLRDHLSNQLVIDTMAGVAGLSSADITSALLTTILKDDDDNTKSALSVLRDLKSDPGTDTKTWTGFLVPKTSDKYTFIGFGDSKPAPLTLAGQAVPFVHQQEDPNDVWSTDPISIIGGQLYPFDSGGQSVPGLQWKTSSSLPSLVPAEALLPNFSGDTATKVFIKLAKAAIIVNGFGLTLDEISYFQTHGDEFGKFDLNDMKLEAWERMLAYTNLRNSLPSGLDITLLDIFKWASNIQSTSHVTTDDLANQITAVTQWTVSEVKTLIGPNCLNIEDPAKYCDEMTLLKLQKALLTAEKIAVDIPSLFKWADPMAKFWPSHGIAEDIRKAIRSQYSLDDWEQVAKPLHDELRVNQRDALTAYLVVQPALMDWGVVDSDSLFEFFLIDTQMGACLQTSRLKQAISTVQTFVQRCILGLELNNDPPIKNNALDQQRWQWMSKQTLWTANRKVFINCEDYIVESLRDDKSPLYANLESELMQKDINPQALQDSIKNYLFNLDEIANLWVEGIFQHDNDAPIYFVAKKRSAPYLFFWRSYSGGSWIPWQPVPIDIPTYHVDACDIPAILGDLDEHNVRKTIYPAYKRNACDGSYVIPYMLGQRFLVFFGQMTLKSFPQPGLDKIELTAGNKVTDVQRLQTWEIKLGWTELRNGKWSPKQVTTDSILENAVSTLAPPQDAYRFIPTTGSETIATGPSTSITAEYIIIHVYGLQGTRIGAFEFHGTHVAIASPAAISFSYSPVTQFHHTVGGTGSPSIIPSLQNPVDNWDPTNGPHVKYPVESNIFPTLKIPHVSPEIPFCHEFSHQLLSVANATTDLGPLYDTYRNQLDTDGSGFGVTSTTEDASGDIFTSYNELSSPYALYNWEVGFHAPLQLADSLLQNQQFDNALNMCHYVFNPYADDDPGKDTPSRAWRWKPFAQVDPLNTLEKLFNSLKPHSPPDTNQPDQINAWRNNPFAPHVVARDRPVAYMKFTVMKYLQILIAYGDYYFRQNTLEAVPLAIQCYILASHIYGPRGQKIPRRGKIKPQTYYSLLDKWDAFGNAVVEMELSFPFSNQTTHPVEFLGSEVVLANVFGFATTHYFSIPDNPQLTALRDLIDDRLYKIRHCQDIDGNTISLALWEPPLDPSLLVNAVAQGLSLSSFLNDLNNPMPNYRFYYLLQKALEMCSELKSFAATFLGLKEKRDAEALQLMRSNQENAIQTLVMEVRTLQLEEANQALLALRASRGGPFYRYKYYTALAGTAQAKLAETDEDYAEIALTITPPKADGDLFLTDAEKNEMDESAAAKDKNDTIGHYESFASAMFAFPRFGEKAEPWGLGVALSMCADNLGKAATAHARSLKIDADTHSWNSSNSGRKATYIRQYQERIQAANSAGYELININTQMDTQNTRIKAAAQEITNQQKQIDNANETLEFLKNKYTNDQLYGWLENSVRTLLYQTYTMAYDLAKKAESAYVFERGPQVSPFIQFGYWDATHDGLQSGERLYVALKKLEIAYQEKRGYDFEITKPVSIRQLNPLAIFTLQQTGSCQIELPEVLFDMDFPGHYFRRIKSVQMTMPCLVGPYTSINCTLRLLSHQYRLTPAATDVNSYVSPPDGTFQSVNVPIDCIAVSTSQNDSGLFELNFKDERYLPFEGAGAISKWQLDLPTAFKQFDYSTITDVIVTIRYTSSNGGEKLKRPASDSVVAYIKTVENLSQAEGLFAVFDLKSEFMSEWYRAAPARVKPPAGTPAPPDRSIALTNIVDRLPLFTKGRDASKIIVMDATVLTETPKLTAANYSFTTSTNSDPVSLEKQPMIGDMNVFAQSNIQRPIGDWVLSIGGDQTVPLMKIWLVLRYVLMP